MFYILNNDIDCSGTTSWNAGAGFVPLGSTGSRFTGYFDGNQHVITDLFINRGDDPDYVGLFSYIGSTGAVEHLGLVDVNITGGTSPGALVGFSEGAIFDVFVSGGTVSGSKIGRA